MSHRQRSLMVLAAACAGVVAFVPTSARAAILTWDAGGAGSVWSDNANWAPDGAIDGNDAKFAAGGAVTTAGAVTNIVDADRTVLSLSYNQFATSGGANQHTTQINDAVTLTLNGTTATSGSALYVGRAADNLTIANLTNVRFVNASGTPNSSAAGGTLRIDNATADLHVRQTSSGTSGGTRQATLDLFGLSHFNATLRDLNVGVGDASNSALNRAVGTMYLAYDNVINANSVQVGANPANGTTTTVSSRLFLGQTNAINTNLLLVGGIQTPRNQMGFNPGVSGGSFTLRGAGGVGRAEMAIGVQPVGVVVGTSTLTNIVDLTGATAGYGNGSIDARVGTLAIGRAGFTTVPTASNRDGVGTFTYNAGTVDANSVVIADDNNAANDSVSTGTLNVNGAAQLIVNNSVTIGKKVNAGFSVANGSLIINGATAKARVSGAVTDGGGASTVNVLAGGTLQAGSLGASASRIDNMTVDNGTIIVDVRAGVPSGAWGYLSNITANNANTIGLQFAPGTLSAGQTIQGINYTGLGGAGFGSFTMSKQPARVQAHLANNPSSIDIVIDEADSPRWNGLVGSPTANDWDVNTTSNWQLITAGTATTYQEDLVTYSTTDSVLFNDLAANTNVEVTTTVAPNAIQINNPTKNYSFTGAGAITGATGIIKTGAGSLTIGNTGGNNFTGTIDLQGGALLTTASNVLPDNGGVAVGAGTTFTLGDFSDTIGALTVVGDVNVNNGTLSAGTIGVSAGSLAITGSGAIAANIMNYSGGAVSIGAGSLTATTLNLSNGVTLSPASGSITATTINIDNATLAPGNVTPAAINVNGSGTINSTVGGVGKLTKSGATGLLTITGNNTYTGTTTLIDGIIHITHANALGSTSGNTQLENGGTEGAGYLDISGGITVAEPIVLAGRRGYTPANLGTGFMNYNPLIVNSSGNNTLTGAITLTTGGTHYALRSDAGTLTIAGNITNPLTGSPIQTRFMHLRGAGTGVISGAFLNTASDATDIIKLDAGTWTLSGNNGTIQKTSVKGGQLNFAAPYYNTGTLDVQDGFRAEVSSGGGSNRVLRANTLTLNATGTLDLKDNKLFTNNAAGTASGGVYSGVQGDVQRANNGG
ncbi:MAG: hypothetical protein QOF78_2813, partial [Phycisphaerales bacterium]|nr:hypothetical protein [Phycisphaerales bacterium]